jgi:hypothetical protein
MQVRVQGEHDNQPSGSKKKEKVSLDQFNYKFPKKVPAERK